MSSDTKSEENTKAKIGINASDVFTIAFIGLGGGLVLATASSFIVLPLLDTFVMEILSNAEGDAARSQNARVLYSYVAIITALSAWVVLAITKAERKCPSCETEWSRKSTGYIRNQDKYTEKKNATRRETRGSGDSMQDRTKDIIETYLIHEYDEIYDCANCDDETVTRKRDKTLQSETVTATTPWQYT